MKATFAVLGLLAMLAACAPLPPPAPPPPAPETASAAKPAKSDDADEPEMKALPPTDVRVMKCAVINSASDDDKAYASTFLLGYRSAMVHLSTVDTKQIDAILQAAVADCAAKPDAVAYKIFAAVQTKVLAQDRVEHGLPPQQQPQQVLRRRPTGLIPAAATPATAPSPETPVAAPQSQPAMRYAPAVITPPVQSMPQAATPAAPAEMPQSAPIDRAAAIPAPAAEKPPAPAEPPATAPAPPANDNSQK